MESSVNYCGQTTLPKAVRDALGLKAGDKVGYVILDEGVLMMPVRPTKCLSGSLKYDGPPVSLEEMDSSIAEGAAGGVLRSRRIDDSRLGTLRDKISENQPPFSIRTFREKPYDPNLRD